MNDKSDISIILNSIDVLQKKIRKDSYTSTLQQDFLDILNKITSLYEDIDCLCYIIPEYSDAIYINGSFQHSRLQTKLISDGISLSQLINNNPIPSHINSKKNDVNLQTKTGYFLAIPITNQLMNTLGTLIFYSKTDRILKEKEPVLIAIAVAFSSLVRYQSLPHLIAPPITNNNRNDKSQNKIKNNKFRQNTVAYRKDQQTSLYNHISHSIHIMGIAFGDGIGIGKAVLHGTPPDPDFYERKHSTKKELSVLNQAIENIEETIEVTLTTHQHHLSTEAIDCLEMHKLLLHDRMWIEQIECGISCGLSTPAAVEYARQTTFFALSAIADPYIRERFADIADLSDKLRIALIEPEKQAHAKEDIILVAHSLGVSSLMEYDMENIKGIILETGSVSSHIAIIANTMNIPMLGQCTNIMQDINSGDQIIIDCDQSVAFAMPEPHTLRLYEHKKTQIKQRERYRSLVAKHQSGETLTRDGIPISLYMNAGLLSEMPMMHDYGAAGIGLLRTELTFMGWTGYPTVSEQIELYKKILDKAGKNKNIVFRTLDIGGDKPLPYFDAPEEENPALGWRAIRIGIDRPAILRTQITAFLKAAGYMQKPLYIVLPMITEVKEITHVRRILEMTMQRMQKEKETLPPYVKMGVMLEVPALLWQLDDVCKASDFISVGSNDLMQYLFAADRGSSLLHNRYDILSPVMLRVFKHIIDTCNKNETPVSICGEVASHPLESMALVALGYKSLSMPGVKIPLIRHMCQSLDTSVLMPYLNKIMLSSSSSIRIELEAFAQDHNINTT